LKGFFQQYIRKFMGVKFKIFKFPLVYNNQKYLTSSKKAYPFDLCGRNPSGILKRNSSFGSYKNFVSKNIVSGIFKFNQLNCSKQLFKQKNVMLGFEIHFFI
jgi:hypothetical protein